MGRKRKKIKDVSDEDLYGSFGAPEPEPSFAGEFERDPDLAAIERAATEKAPGLAPPLSGNEPPNHQRRPEDEIDLHGLTGPEALLKLIDFIRVARTLRYRTIRVVTGKGRHSEGPAVLPSAVWSRLKELADAGLISGFAWEKKRRSRSGAVIVHLD